MSKIAEYAAKQLTDWNGASGANWVRRQEEQDRVLKPASDLLFAAAALKLGERVIDVGCGCGDTTLEAMRRVGPGGAALGVDISEPMVARARERAAAEGLAAQFRVEDAAVSAFPPGGADAVISRFGVMFFPDPAPAFANLRRAVRPGGRIVFICWRPVRENEWMMVPLRAALTCAPRLPDPDPDEPGPFALADPGKVRRLLEGAGFHDLSMTPRDLTLDIAAGQGFDSAVESACSIGPASRVLKAASDTERAASRAAIREALKTYAKGPSVSLGAAPWVVEARV